MAIPTLGILTPRTGPPYGGYLVTISGTGFRVPDLLPDSSITQESVRIWIGTYQVPPHWIKVRSALKIEIRMPEDVSDPAVTVYPLSQSVTLRNIDALGVPIPGEVAVLPVGFTYSKVDLNGTLTESIWRSLRRFLSRNLPVNSVVGVVNVDYQSDTVVSLPQGTVLPVIILLGPRLKSSPMGTQILQDIDAEQVVVSRLPKAYDYVYDIQLITNHKQEQDALQSRIEQVVRNASAMVFTWLGYSVEMPIRWEEPISLTSLSDLEGGVLQSIGSLIVENVPAEGDIVASDSGTIEDINISFKELL